MAAPMGLAGIFIDVREIQIDRKGVVLFGFRVER